MSLARTLASRVQLALFRALGGAAARLEPRHDPAHMAQQFERGELVHRAFVDAGASLRRAGRFDDADAMVERGLAVYPADRSLLYEHAFSAHAAGRYAVAISRWEAALAVAPDLAMCHAGVAANLRETGAVERAAAVIAAALARFPDDLTILSEAARIADMRLRFDEALPLWRRAAEATSPAPEWLQGEAHALLRLGRVEEAQQALDRARRRFPEAPGLRAVEGLLASERGDWPKAVALWSDYRRRYPEDGNGEVQLARALAGERSAAPPTGADEADVRRLMLGFESLGETCEFAVVQRRYGAEPAGLLRWNDVTYDGLIAALGARFAGLGEPAETQLVIAPDGDLLVEDRRWGLALHTRFEGDEDREALLARVCRDTGALKDKLLAELAAGEKIFVYRSSGLDGDRLEALHRALRVHGPVRLLAIQPAAPTAPTSIQGAAGELVEVGEGLFVGFLERLGVQTGGTWDVACDDWVAVCRKAAAIER